MKIRVQSTGEEIEKKRSFQAGILGDFSDVKHTSNNRYLVANQKLPFEQGKDIFKARFPLILVIFTFKLFN